MKGYNITDLSNFPSASMWCLVLHFKTCIWSVRLPSFRVMVTTLMKETCNLSLCCGLMLRTCSIFTTFIHSKSITGWETPERPPLIIITMMMMMMMVPVLVGHLWGQGRGLYFHLASVHFILGSYKFLMVNKFILFYVFQYITITSANKDNFAFPF